MAQDGYDSFSFWQLATPAQGARAVVEMFGDDAAAQAKRLAREALATGQDADHRFWTAVYARLVTADSRLANRAGS